MSSLPHPSSFLTVGVPTVRRPTGISYLKETIERLLASEGDFRIVVVDADVDESSIQELPNERVTYFKVKPELYPSWPLNPRIPTDERCVDETPDRRAWRTKQAWDSVIVMERCLAEGSEWFIHVEDDCLAKPGWFAELFSYLTRTSVKYVRFSDRGYFGHAFHKDVIPSVLDFVKQRWDTLPIDWLIDWVPLQWEVGPNLFEHVGQVSSLAGQFRAESGQYRAG